MRSGLSEPSAVLPNEEILGESNGSGTQHVTNTVLGIAANTHVTDFPGIFPIGNPIHFGCAFPMLN